MIKVGRSQLSNAPAARCGFLAAAVLLAVGLAVFVASITMISVQRHVSLATAIFGPLPGNPMIVWLYWVMPGVLLQVGVALALRHRWTGLRMAGTVAAFAIAVLCLAWVGAMLYDLFTWLIRGTTSGDLQDLVGEIVFGVPFGLLIGGLNACAGWLSLRDLRAHGGRPRSHLRSI